MTVEINNGGRDNGVSSPYFASPKRVILDTCNKEKKADQPSNCRRAGNSFFNYAEATLAAALSTFTAPTTDDFVLCSNKISTLSSL